MLDGFDCARDEYLREWQDGQRTLLMLDDRHCGEHDRAAGQCHVRGRQNIYRVGAAMIHAHEAKNFPGGLVANGPVTQQDRWEEDSGYSPFTLAAEIAALLAAADIAERLGEGVSTGYLRETADHWYAGIGPRPNAGKGPISE